MDETGVVASLALHVVLEPIFVEVSVTEKTVVANLCPYVVVTTFFKLSLINWFLTIRHCIA